jgi:hypothetical protein
MKRLLWVGVIAAAGAAPAADTAVFGRGADSAPPPLADGTRELKWDNGDWEFLVYWYTGAGSWAANDFAEGSPGDTHGRYVASFKLFSSPLVPNQAWDGFRVAIYEFRGMPRGVPGEKLWPAAGEGRFFLPSGPGGHGWVSVPIGWVVTTPFVAALEQFYDPPACDPFAVDSNRTDLGHSWSYYGGLWRRFESTADPYRNIMLRVIVEDLPYHPAVAPASFGRVRALYK